MNQKVICLLYYNYIKMFKVVVSLCFFLLWERAIHLGTCSQAETVDVDAFTIQHKTTGRCLTAEGLAGLGLASCPPASSGETSHIWKWGSGHRLFNVAKSLCLGLHFPTKALRLFHCSFEDPADDSVLSWRCPEGALLHTDYQTGLAVTDGKVVGKRDAADSWTRDGTQENVCQRPYRVVHTSDGNSAGAPCEFPFLANGSWHHGCLPEQDSAGTFWCSTTSDFDHDRKNGRCLIPEEGCGRLFAPAAEETCLQFVSGAAVTWQEALDSCRSQGSDLLSLGGPGDLNSSTFKAGLSRMPEKMWMGLHQLDMAEGWQWSDGSGVAYLRWEEEMPSTSSLSESDCGALNSKQNYVSESCTARLPYVCKKSSKASHQATEASEYKATVCPDGWVPWNGWCYRLVKDGPKGFEEAQAHCKSTELGGGGTLASLHSLDTKEMISTYFYTEGSPPDVWIGLKWIDTSTVFRWADGTPVNFTYWGPNQPSQPKQYSSCVFLSGESHGWRVGNCTDRRPFLCQREGKVNETTTQSACPAQGGWRRHGNSCFQVNTAEVSFKDHCNITIRNGFEQAFLSRLLGEQMGNGTRYFWMGLQDVKNTGEYQWLSPDSITYTNWGSVEPSHDGGCAVMSKAKPIGRWEVKNCTDFKAGTICKKELSPPPPVKPEPDPNLPCPDGWLSRPQIKYCYKVFHGERLSRKRSWEEAQRFCQALGANLASFNKEDEMDALHSVMRDSISDSRYFWVGLNRRNPADRSWSWSDGRPVSMGILQQEFHEDDAYKRDCTAFKSMKSSFRRMVWVMLHDLRHATFYAIPFRCDAKLEWVCQIPKGKTPKVPEWYNPGGHHETSIFVDNSEFWFVKEPRLTFDEAGLFCSMNGSKLAAPVSFIAASKIHQYLDETSDSPNQSWWADMQWPGRFFPMRFSQMHFYHSVFLGRCTSISAENQFPEYEYSCERPLPFVCERHNITLVERNPLEADPRGFTCGNATLAFRDKCFILLTPSTQASFSLANEECMSLGSTLVTVSDQVEQDFITTLLPKMPEMQNIWIGLKLRSDYPEWVDATPVSFLNFNPLLHGMLKPIRINTLIPESMQLCAYMINHHSSDVMATWDYSPCTEFQYSSICQHYADKPEKTQEPQGPIHINNHTIQVLWKNLTWSEARQQCRDLGMDLASVADVFLQASLTVLVSRARMPMWIGLVSEDEGIHYRWSDNSHTVFSRWSSETSSGACVYLDTDGFWKATECDEMLGGAICHVPHEETIKKAEEAPVKCPHTIKGPNWIPFRNNCYSIQLVSSRWDNVQKGRIQDTCKNLYGSATILTIRNADENEFIRQQLLPFSSLVQYVWLGLFKDDNDNQMKWYDGTDVQYSNWRNGRPDVAGEFMAGLKADGIWELITNNQYIAPFRQRSVVACKVDNEPREKYNQTMKKIQNYGNLTYQVVTRKLNWFQAVEECGRRGGHLASIHDIQHDVHMEFITRTDSFPLWIGLSSQGISASSRSEWTRSDHLSYEWSDGTRYEYSASISDSQKTPSIPPQQGCVFVNATGGWVRSDCHALLDGAICYNTSITTSSQRAKLRMSTVSSNCPPTNDSSTWVEFRDHCYAINMSFYHSQVYNMQQAQGICQKLGAHLLTINSQEENDFVVARISEDPLITSRVWLGMEMNHLGSPLAWVDNSSLGFSNWGTSRATVGDGLNPPCVVMETGNRGLWRRTSCTDSHSRVVCKTASTRSRGAPVALVLFLVIVLALLGFLVYKKKRAYFSSTVRYKRDFGEEDTTRIMTEDE